MKTAISIPDALFQAAEQASKRRGVSRSQFYSQALEAYLKSQRASGVKERLDALYATEDSAVESLLSRLQDGTLNTEDWPCVAEKSGGRR